MRMKLIGAALLALGTITATAGSAEARDGCGLGFHRNVYGFCRPNGFYRPYAFRPAYGYGWRRHYGWHRHWGWHRHVGWRGGWHHGWRRW